uniref:hypothetical protein n=1 Tax=Streptomyces scabiei TaxID=1930 RepID=UPI0038F5E3A6
DLAGNALDLSARVGCYIMQDSDVVNLLYRNAIFASFNDGQGWTPEPLAIPVVPDEPVAITPVNNNLGFAGYNFNLTGGAGGTVVTVDNGT